MYTTPERYPSPEAGEPQALKTAQYRCGNGHTTTVTSECYGDFFLDPGTYSLPQDAQRLPMTACSACEREVAVRDTTPHYRGGGNFPLCPLCASPARMVQCDECGEPSPFDLMSVEHDPGEDGATFVYCPCKPLAELLTARDARKAAA